jgi:putative oxidoreductase
MSSWLRKIEIVRERSVGLVRHLEWLAPLVARLTLGLVFVRAGFGKVQNLDRVTGFFTKLHIPAPAFNAALVGWSELICGALLLVGFLSRLATIPLIVTMIVALATAKANEIHTPFDLLGQVEFTFLALLLVIALVGPGLASLDAWIARYLSHQRDDDELRYRHPTGMRPRHV